MEESSLAMLMIDYPWAFDLVDQAHSIIHFTLTGKLLINILDLSCKSVCC